MSRVRIVAGIVLSCLVSSKCLGAFNKIIVFGDSLSDMGNISAGTLGVQPGSNYYQGRFSNGLVWIERLATRYNIALARSGASGTNWAFGGASSGTGTFGFLFFQFPNVSTQVSRYLAANPAINANQLYVVWCGANDYFDGQTDGTIPPSRIDADIRTLYARGARQFLIPNLPLLGNTPRYRGTVDEIPKNAVSQTHNTTLASKIATLRTDFPAATFIAFDVASNLNDVQAHPANYGLTNVTQPALVGSTVVPNPDQYLFYDEVHPTRIGHQLLSDVAYQLTAPPSTITGTVDLQNWLGPIGAYPVTFTLKQGTTVVQTFAPTTLSSNGGFTIQSTRFGTYDLLAKVGHWLIKKQSVTLNSSSVNVAFSLINGDVDEDNEVGSNDFDAVVAAFGSSNSNTDLDGDGEVGSSDFDLVTANFGLNGD
ncbi:MAG: hypothetical protein J0L72_09630 [Armatimonadetes bacterium]|nr:hypothetical protein [Armatimonadota bacterium]